MSRNELLKELNQILKSRNFSLLHFNITHIKKKQNIKNLYYLGKFKFLSNLFLFISFIPITKYILYPLIVLVFSLLTIPFYLNQHYDVLKCKGDRVFVRKSISFDEHQIPIKYLDETHYMINRSNDLEFRISRTKDLTQPNSRNSFLATASKNIILNLLNGYDITHDDPRYQIVSGCGFRVIVKNN
ncbi:hypothetical protein ACTFIY_004873 [Dictyostelium cf. discoideum]